MRTFALITTAAITIAIYHDRAAEAATITLTVDGKNISRSVSSTVSDADLARFLSAIRSNTMGTSDVPSTDEEAVEKWWNSVTQAISNTVLNYDREKAVKNIQPPVISRKKDTP